MRSRDWFYGSTAIIGNSIPVGVGIVLANKIKEMKELYVFILGRSDGRRGFL